MERFFQHKRKFQPSSSSSSDASSPAITSSQAQELLAFDNQSNNQQKSYRTMLTAMLDCTRFLLMQGLTLRGLDESKESLNRGNLIELLDWYVARCEKVNASVFNNFLENDQMIAPNIQKDLVNCCAVETTKVIMKEMGDSLFSLLVDEFSDDFVGEQITVILRFVDKSGQAKERFLGIFHVIDTCAQSLKDAIDVIFSRHGLSISSLRGQCYVASNMSNEFNDLKALILRENPYAFYVHCFAHQLQLTIISVARRNIMIGDFFNMLTIIVNLVGASCNHADALRASYHSEILMKLNIDELCGGSVKFQEMSLARLSDTRWDSHLGIITHFISMFDNILDVLENILEDGIDSGERAMASRQMSIMQNFEFVFCLHFMFEILTITNDLSQALQKKDHDIQNVMTLLDFCKYALQNMRNNSWDDFLSRVIEFCVGRYIIVPNMEDIVVFEGLPRRRDQHVTYYHQFYVDLYCNMIDSILQELNDRFSETTSELLTCISCLSPRASFAAFDKTKLLRLAQFYPLDFTGEDLMLLRPQLDKFLMLVRRDKTFFNLNSISCITQKLVETGLSCYFPLVYRLLTLTLILPLANASVERACSTMNLIKSELHNKMEEDWLNDNLVVYTEQEIFKKIENEAILQRFQNMRPRRMQLSELTVTD